jgi:hypothetical protein
LSKWYSLNDERVKQVTEREAVDANFGGFDRSMIVAVHPYLRKDVPVSYTREQAAEERGLNPT